MADGTLFFDTKIDESGFSSGIKRLGSIAKGGLGILGSAVAGVTGAMTAGVAAGIKYNASIEQYQTSFEVMTGSARKAASIMEELQKIGAETPFETETIAETTQRLMSYGFAADDAIDKMQMLGDISQGSAEKLETISDAYGKMTSSSIVQREEINRMIDAGFNPLQEISEETGESMADLYDRISAGAMSVDEITASMERSTSAGGKYFQSMALQAETFSGLMSTLKDSAMMMLGTITQGLFESSKDLVSQGIEAIGQLETAFKEGGAAGMLEAGQQILTNLLQGIANGAPAVIETALSIIGMLASSIGGALPQLVASGFKIVTSLLSGISSNGEAIVSKAIDIVTKVGATITKNLPVLLKAGLQMIMSLANGIIDNLPVLIEKVPQLINSFFDALWRFIPQLIAAGLKLIVQLGVGIVKSIPTIIKNADQIVLAIINVFNAVSLLKIGKTIINSLGNGIKAMARNVRSKAKDIGQRIKNAISNISWGGVGRGIINGIASGLSGAAGAIVRAAKTAAKNALNAAKEFLGINSPSRVFRDEVGKYMALGIGVGFEENMPKEIQDMESAMNGAVRSVQAAVTGVALDPVKTGNIKATGLETGDIGLKKLGKEITDAVKAVGEKPVYLNSRKINQSMRMQRTVTV